MARLKQLPPVSPKWFFIVVSLIVVYLFWQIIAPYATTLITAGVAAIMIAPLEARLRAYLKNRHLSSAMMVSLVLLVVLIPLSIVGVIMVQQASELIQASVGEGGWLRTFDVHSNAFYQMLPAFLQQEVSRIEFGAVAASIAQWVFNHLIVIFSGTANVLLNMFVFIIALYYMLVDREKIFAEVLAMSPFKDSLDKQILTRIVHTVRSVVFGALVISVVQGTLAGIGMTLFGVPGALIWGAMAVVAAELPLIGVGFILIPATIYVFLFEPLGPAIGFLIWNVIIVGLADNVLSPQLIKGKTHMHALLILISILGGLELMGPIGFIIGPTILAAFMVVVEMYKQGYLRTEK